MIKFLADEDLTLHIVSAVKRIESSIDFETVDAAGLKGAPDEVILKFAAAENRVVISHDRKTMPRHFAKFMMDTISPGLLIVGQNISTREAAEEIVLIWLADEPAIWINRIAALPL